MHMSIDIVRDRISKFFKGLPHTVRNLDYVTVLLLIAIGGNLLLFLGVRKEIIGLIIAGIGSAMIAYLIIRIRFR